MSFLDWIDEEKPKILHLSAHGNQGYIFFEDEDKKQYPVNIETIADIIKTHNKSTTTPIKGVVLSACYSAVDANKLADNVEFVIAMSKSVQVNSAIVFAEAFYTKLRQGKSIQYAFDMGRACITDKNQKEIPILLPAKNRNFSEMYMIKKN